VGFVESRPFFTDNSGEIVQATFEALQLVTFLASLRNQYKRGYRRSLLSLLEQCRLARATLARDHMFALLGLAEDAEDASFDPDYDEPLKAIVRRYGACFVRRGNIELLFQAGLGPSSSQFPSWIPDWTSPSYLRRNMEHLATYVSSSNKRLYLKNTYSAGAHAQPRLRYDMKTDTLTMEGVLVDVISRVGDDPGPLDFTPETRRYSRVRACLWSSDAIMDTLTTYPTGEDLQEAQWRTLVANRTAEMTEPPKEFAEPFLEAANFWREPNPSDRYSSGQELIAIDNRLRPFLEAFAAWNKRFCSTEKGYIGLVLLRTQPGDLVFVPFGSAVPLILRRSDERLGFCQLVGSSYLHGIMNGEALRERFKEEVMSLY
jgi:hypothetical protein